MYNPDQEQFPQGEGSLKWENIAKPPICNGFMPLHHFSHLTGHSSLSGATLEEELGCSSEKPSSLQQTRWKYLLMWALLLATHSSKGPVAQISKPICFLKGSGCSRTLKLPSPGGSYHKVVPFRQRSWVLCQGPATQQTQGQAEATKCVSVFSLRLWRTQVKHICDKLSLIWLSFLPCYTLKQASAQDHSQHLCRIWVR